jgi:cation diffusion facilitator CzcD-associated flavoprotein CzcO
MPSFNPFADICIAMVDEPAYSNRRLRVATIGAGFSGLVLAHKIQHEFPELQEFIDHTIFELQDDIGGAWKVNTYPGVQCDVPAHVYVSVPSTRWSIRALIRPLKAFPFDPNPAWSKFYADGDEILEYMKKRCDKWDLRRNVQFNTRVVANEWLEEEGKWRITVEKDGQRRDEYADILVSAQGFLR